MTNRAFTLIEVMVSVMLIGMLSSLALAPVIITVRRTVQVQEDYSGRSALSRTMNFIARDLTAAMRLSPSPIAIVDHEALGGAADDVLLVMTTTPSAQNRPSGTVVYRVDDGGIMHTGVLPGLYRWVLPGQTPSNVDPEKLDIEDAQLVLPYVKDFSVEVPSASHEEENLKNYRGQLPAGIILKMSRGQRTGTLSLGEEDERNELESVIVFP